MANFVVTSDATSASGPVHPALATNDRLFVGRDATLTQNGTGAAAAPVIVGADRNLMFIEGELFSAESSAIRTGSSNSITVGRDASLLAGFAGIEAFGGPTAITVEGSIAALNGLLSVSPGGNEVTVLDTGNVSGVFAINFGGDSNRIVNHGTIAGTAQIDFVAGFGVFFQQDSGFNRVENTGTITGHIGIQLAGNAGEANVVINAGTVEGRFGLAIQGDTAAGAAVHDTIFNTGEILGNVDLRAGNDRLFNTGVIIGSVQLGDGQDVYDARAGAVPTGLGDGSVFGGAGNDTLLGGASSEALFGENDDDTIRGYGGDDSLDGGGGSDRLFGGNGNDDLVGGTEGDALDGGEGDDSLTGGTGADTLIGGSGSDRYIVDHSADQVIEVAAEGTDEVQSSATFALADPDVENLTLTGAGNINGTGNAARNVIVGNGGANTLSGLAGADVLIGGAGNDVLIGGLGADTMNGGLGADRFDFNSLAESPRGAGRDIVTFNRAEADKIDLSTIDADTNGTAGNQAFRFIGGAAFSGVDGQLRFSGGGVLQGDTNGDRVADIEIRILGALLARDVIL
jgi:Ca2+-binding RTX toxin-like protein